MNILMLTNTYTPFIGGVPRSVETFTREYRRLGHRTIVIAPEFENMPENEEDVIRVPAIQHFNGSDFSLQLPVPGMVSEALEGFRPDIVHSHHPYLVGDTALRLAARFRVPLVFTHHTRYEQYTHYVPGDSDLLRRFVVALTVGYANLCDRVFAPSESIADLLRERNVETPVDVIPTGIDIAFFAGGDNSRGRVENGIPPDAFVAGFVSRIAPEKNIAFLADAVSRFMVADPEVHFIVAGEGPSASELVEVFTRRGLRSRLHLPGALTGKDLADTYHAMDVFAFASKSETQGMVIAEAMAAGVPVVSLDAPGAREIVRDGENGFLLRDDDPENFARMLTRVRALPEDRRRGLSVKARQSAELFAAPRCALRALDAYCSVICLGCKPRSGADNPWEESKRLFHAEWEILANMVHAAGSAVTHAARNDPVPGEFPGNQ